MSTSRSWTPQEVNLLKTLRPTHSNREIADEFERRADMGSSRIFARSVDAIQKKCKRDEITAASTVDFDPQDAVVSRIEQLKVIQAKYKQPQVRIKRGVFDQSKIVRKIVSISDIHVPFADSDMLEEVVAEHAGPGVWLVINGDLLECYAYSFFTKHSSVTGLHEYQCAFLLVQWLRTKFDKVFITSGNHDKRVSRQLKDIGWGSDMSKVLRPDLLARIANGEELDDSGTLVAKHDWDNVYYEQVESWYIRIGKTVFFHPSTKPSARPGETVQKWAKKFLERYDPHEVDSFVCGHCFDEETEILTAHGWKGIDEISEEDMVGTLNLDTNCFEWNTPEAVWRYDHHDSLIKIGMDDRLQIAVTPEHGMIWKTSNDLAADKPWRLTQAYELLERAQAVIPTSAIETANNDFPIEDSLLSLYAWVITEGNISRNGRLVRIAQSDDPNGYCSEIETHLDKLNLSYSKVHRYKAKTLEHGTFRNFDAYMYNLSANASELLSEFIIIEPEKAFKPELLLNLSQRQRLLLIQEMCKGDGSKCGTEVFRHYYTKSTKLKDQFQMLLTMSGFSNNAKLRIDGTWYISFSDKTQKFVSDFREEEYCGRTFCLTVPNGTLVARRRGWVFITQNTHKVYEGVVNGYKMMEQGTLAGLMAYAFNPRVLYDGNGQNGYAVIYQDEHGNTSFNDSHVFYLGEVVPPKKSVIA